MTVLKKPILSIKKIPLIDEKRCDEDVIDIRIIPPAQPIKRNKRAMQCITALITLLLLTGMIVVTQFYEQVNTDTQRHNHYKGYCSVPLSQDSQTSVPKKAPLHWKASESPEQVAAEIQVLNLLDEEPKIFVNALGEALDINIDDSIEKITVMNNGHPVSFIHDFEANITGIIDSERCFTMPLDGTVVVRPELFVLGLQRGDEFDVSRLRTALRAVLRDALAPPDLRRRCGARPVYALERAGAFVVRKRSVDEPPHDYIQFAGNRIQEIEISNLAELLEYEQKKKLSA